MINTIPGWFEYSRESSYHMVQVGVTKCERLHPQAYIAGNGRGLDELGCPGADTRRTPHDVVQ